MYILRVVPWLHVFRPPVCWDDLLSCTEECTVCVCVCVYIRIYIKLFRPCALICRPYIVTILLIMMLIAEVLIYHIFWYNQTDRNYVLTRIS
jgi:hypothetical protein